MVSYVSALSQALNFFTCILNLETCEAVRRGAWMGLKDKGFFQWSVTYLDMDTALWYYYQEIKKQVFGKYDFSIEFTLMFELTHFSPMFQFYIPRTRQKTFGVDIFKGYRNGKLG